jgi:hypothetical protein
VKVEWRNDALQHSVAAAAQEYQSNWADKKYTTSTHHLIPIPFFETVPGKADEFKKILISFARKKAVYLIEVNLIHT